MSCCYGFYVVALWYLQSKLESCNQNLTSSERIPIKTWSLAWHTHTLKNKKSATLHWHVLMCVSVCIRVWSAQYCSGDDERRELGDWVLFTCSCYIKVLWNAGDAQPHSSVWLRPCVYVSVGVSSNTNTILITFDQQCSGWHCVRLPWPQIWDQLLFTLLLLKVLTKHPT